MLKSLMLRKKIDAANKALEEARSKRDELQKRESEIAQAIEEAAEGTDEEKAAVEEAITAHEAETAETEAKIESLEKDVAEMESELADIEARQNTTPAPAEVTPAETTPTENRTMEVKIMKRFKEMTHEERSAFVARDEVQSFLERTRELIKNKRDITGKEYLIPEVVLDLVKANVEDYSKLINAVNKVPVAGKARQTIMGLIPEAIWTEMCGKLNELDFSFANVEVDGFKVGGFVPVCNALAEDNDVNLLAELVSGIGQAIGYAIDKAILYGTGVKMPTGIVTALDKDTTLKTTNIISIASAKTGVALFQEILKATKKISKKYAQGGLVWVMNNNTLTDLKTEGLNINAAGTIVAGIQNTMPVVGGEVIELDFVPDNTIIVGYMKLYTLAERAGTAISTSEHVRFIEDQTVIKGTARYDGKPVIKSAFAAIGLAGTTPAASAVTFAPDTANPDPDDDDSQG